MAKEYTFINRDLSWLSFNHRVLLEAADESVPLYSRIQFLSIFSSNLDEFFRVRMPSIYAFSSINAKKTSLREEYPENLSQTGDRLYAGAPGRFRKNIYKTNFTLSRRKQYSSLLRR
jgi:polyphosphate kinase